MPTSSFDLRCERVARLWRAGGCTPGTAGVYLRWVRRFHVYCLGRGIAEEAVLTRDAVDTFTTAYARARRCKLNPARAGARNALHAWSCALQVLGVTVPLWTEPRAARPTPRVIAQFVDHRIRHGGVAQRSVRADVYYVSAFLAFLRARGRRLAAVRLVDIDAYVSSCARRWARKTVSGMCSVLRAFLRFRFARGHLRRDLASAIVSPRTRPLERPPRAMPWKDVQRLLRAIDIHASLGRRDFALLLTMATYGMGAGEVLGLRVDDVDWEARILHVRRAKTGTAMALPLLDPVARALAEYLRHGRPRHATAREIFVSHGMPYNRMTAASAIRHRLVKHAAAAGLTPAFIGSHVLRHSHACRQIELGATPKVVSDILGHRRPSSTSAYVRVATGRLRELALPVPR
jgi:integrase/recombinase XerD